MRTFQPDLRFLIFAVLAGALSWLPAGADLEAQQVRDIASSQIAVSSDEATLRLELEGDETFEVALRDGEVTLDGQSVGSFSGGDALDSSWRALLSEAVQLSGDPLARALIDWSPPAGLEGQGATAASELDRALEERLSPSEQAPVTAAADDPEPGSQPAQLERLLRRGERLGALAAALEGLSLEDVRVHIDEDVTVSGDDEVDGTLIVVDGDLEVLGTVRGDVVITGGTLRLGEGGRITGEARLSDARIERENGTIGGGARNVPVEAPPTLDDLGDLQDLEGLEEDLRERIRDEIRSALRAELGERGEGIAILRPLRYVGRGLAGLLRNLVTFGLVLVAGMLAVRFFPENLERVLETGRRSPGRSALVGFAGTFLFLPVWVLGIVALAISIIGIPALLAWIPLFPLASALAIAFGYLAVAAILGEWILRHEVPGLDMLRPSNRIHSLAVGTAALLIPFALANVVQMAGPWLGFLSGMLLATGWIAATLAATVGLGAILLTRGGRRPGYGSGGPGPRPGWTPPASPPPPSDAAEDDEWREQWEDLEREASQRAPDADEKQAADEATSPEDERASAGDERTSTDDPLDDHEEPDTDGESRKDRRSSGG